MTIQEKRAAALRTYNSGWFLAVRIAAYFFAGVGIVLVLTSYLFSLAAAVAAIGLVIIAPGALLYSFGLFVSFLQRHPLYGLSTRDLADIRNRYSFATVRILSQLRSTATWQRFLTELLEDQAILEVLLRLNISSATLHELFDHLAVTPRDYDDLVEKIHRRAGPEGEIDTTVLLRAFLERSEFIEFFTKELISPEEVERIIAYYQQIADRRRRRAEFWVLEEGRSGGFAASWATGYTSLVDRFTAEVPPSIRFHVNASPLYSRETIVKEVLLELQKENNHNVLLVGEEGVGRQEVFYHLADQLLHYQTKTPLDGVMIRVLQTQQLLSSASSTEELQALLADVFAELSKVGSIVLYIDSIEMVLRDDDEVGTIDLRQLLANYLNDSRIHLIASISSNAYLQFVKNDPGLNKVWAAIKVPEPTEADIPLILLSRIQQIEYRYRCFFQYRALRAIVEYSRQYLSDDASPQREITIAEEVAARQHGSSVAIIDPAAVEQVIEQKSGVPIRVGEKEQSTLLNLPSLLHQRLIGQDLALQQISDALLRARSGLRSGEKPIGSFLFLGPTGVGKTETAKALAQIYFGSQQRILRLDMSEYAQPNALEKLLGTDPVAQPGPLTLAIQQNPSTVVLLDEFEKASSQVQNAFLQVFDEGKLTTNFGKVLRFSNCIIIATSNAGSELIREQANETTIGASFQKTLLDSLMSGGVFSPELLNRFDAIVVYAPLTHAQLQQIVQLRLTELKEKLQKEKGITLAVASEVIESLIEKGYDPVFGARALERVVQEELGTKIAREIISKQAQPGTTLRIDSL